MMATISQPGRNYDVINFKGNIFGRTIYPPSLTVIAFTLAKLLKRTVRTRGKRWLETRIPVRWPNDLVKTLLIKTNFGFRFLPTPHHCFYIN